MRKEETFDHIAQAYVRKPGKNFAEGISTATGTPDYDLACQQHQNYIKTLQKCGVTVSILRTDPLFPDGSFLSDMAVVTNQMAVLSNFPDQSPRQGEQAAAATVLGATHFLKFITAPGRLDAGDVLQVGQQFYIGLSDHTNQAGAEQLCTHLKDFGYQASIIDLAAENILRLRAAAAYLGKDRLLIREEITRHYAFLEYDKIIVPANLRGAANSIMINGTLVMPAGHAEIADEVRSYDIPMIEVDISEFEKRGGGLSCLSIRPPHLEKGNVVLLPSFGRKTA